MSELIVIDPARGFVALPAQIFDLEISPGAFRVLTHLCNLADVAGWSWASLDQFAERIGRSKSSVSGYLQELRRENLIACTQQTRANGANYRLKIRVTFWADWVKSRAKCAKAKAQPAERSVRPAERHIEDKNKPNKTHTTPKAGGFIEKVLKGWQELSKGQPFGQFSGDASPALLADTQKALSNWQPLPRLPKETIQAQIADLWSSLAVSAPFSTQQAQVTRCIETRSTVATLQALCAEIKHTWKAHWSKPPTLSQFNEMLSKSISATPRDTIFRLIRQDYQRYIVLNPT